MKKLRGEPGENLKTSLELKKIADVAFIGYPNAGKSTLLNGLSNMNVTISAEPFTTLKPNVANLVFKNKKFKIADLITDGPIIRDARMKAFEIIKNDANLSQQNHSFIKQKFDNEYLKLFLKTTVN